MKLFTIGDSISQGFMSGAAARTDLSYSTLIAHALKLQNYQYPDIWKANGLPFNLEYLLRQLEKKYGSNINGFDWVTLLPYIDRMLDEVEDYYEREEGREDNPNIDGKDFYHNVAVQGFDVADAFIVTPKVCREEIARSNKKKENKDDSLIRSLGRSLGLPNASFYRTALKVLNPSLNPDYDNYSQLEWLSHHARTEGVENLLLWLGANNALGTVIGLNIKPTPNDHRTDLLRLTREDREQWNLWHPNDFKIEYRELLNRVESSMKNNLCKDFNVFIGTIPLVTIAPLAKGVGPATVIEVDSDYPDEKRESIYYKYYTYFFRDERTVLETDRAYLTLSEALYIDDCIRQYNRIIKELVNEINQQYKAISGRDRYHVVDICKALQDLAFKRNAGQVQYRLPEYFKFKYPGVNTKYYHADAQGRLRQGGVFSLDGIHPSAIGQGLIAYEFLKVMKEVGVGVNFNIDYNLNWDSIFASDTLYQLPISVMHEFYENKNLTEFAINLISKGSSAGSRSVA
jgi:hypothetical protein